jgi:hypothetical protein
MANFNFPLPIVGGGTGQTTAPSFLAYLSSTASNTTGDGTAFTVVFGSTVFNITTSYATGTGLFTAPLTGNYYFQTNLVFEPLLSGHTKGTLSFVVGSGAIYIVAFRNPFAQNNGTQTVYNSSAIIPLSSTDTVKVVLTITGSTKTVSILGQAIASGGLATFSGFLLK